MGGRGSGRIPAPAALKLLHGSRPGRDSGGRKVPVPPKFDRAPHRPTRLLLLVPHRLGRPGQQRLPRPEGGHHGLTG